MKESVVRRHSVASYFVMTFFLSWMGAFCLAAPYLFHHRPIPQMSGILMFPAMLAGPCVSSLVLTGILDGRAGLRDLFSRMGRVRVGAQWYAVADLSGNTPIADNALHAWRTDSFHAHHPDAVSPSVGFHSGDGELVSQNDKLG